MASKYSNQSATVVDINHHFDGSFHWFKGYHYRNPTRSDGPLPTVETSRHKDVLKRVTYRPRDLARYISPTYGKPYHMLVQAASNAPAPGDWRRRAVKGNAPTLLRVASWAIGSKADEAENTVESVFLTIGKSILVVPVVLFIVAYPMGSAPNSSPHYKAFPHRCYEYPKHALNDLDASPKASKEVYGTQNSEKSIIYEVKGEQKRLLRPRALVVYRNNTWAVIEDGSYSGPYLFMSYAAMQYQLSAPTQENPNNAVVDTAFLDYRARNLALTLGIHAYWSDYHCMATQQPYQTDDVHRFCDVVRGAHTVCVLLPDQIPQSLVQYGQRLWCLPEVLLARNHQVLLATPDANHTESIETINIMEMTHRAWAVRTASDNSIIPDVNEETFRLLAEHYTGTLTLSRLELIQVALQALRSRTYKEFQQSDLAYALMTLLTKRPRMDPSDTEQQALARLSLANDSDRIVERMACMDQVRISGQPGWFNTSDDLGANLWDIEPLCQVAGVCHDGSLILDGCHGISIRWKNIPRIHFLVRDSWKKTWAGLSLRSGPFWFLLGIIFVIIPTTKSAGVFFLILGLLLLVTAPWSVTTLYGGKVWGAKPWLIGFEGTLPLEEIEHLTFGNVIGRFSYTPSSGPYCARDPTERIGAVPSIDAASLPEGYRFFTLIDTGIMTVTVFAAARPPSVALICGKEGGMLRAVMCSFERETNSLRKECVLRMETPMWDLSTLMGWVKLS